jgi:hypothetical protein
MIRRLEVAGERCGRYARLPLRHAGSHEVLWDGSGTGGPVASGLYFVRLDAADRRASGRFVLIR